LEEKQTSWYVLQPKNVPHFTFLRLPLVEHAFDISPILTAEYIVTTIERYLILLHENHMNQPRGK